MQMRMNVIPYARTTAISRWTMSQEKEQTQEKHSRQTGARLALEVGIRMSISLGADRDSHEGRIAADLVGVVHFEYLIVRLPWVPGLRTRLVGGAVATVRLVSQGELCGFQSEILTHVTKPALLLFLQYPEVIEKLALRQHKRVQCALPAQFHSRRGDAQGVIGDLSRGGCRLAFNARGQHELRQTVAGDILVVRATLSANGLPLAVTCTVRSVETDSNRILLGVSFTEADQEFWSSLDLFLAHSELLS